MAARVVVLVEGVTDELALTLAAARLGRDLSAEGVTVVPINGAHAIGRFMRQLSAEAPMPKLAGLYDAGEEEVIRAAMERAGHGSSLDGFFACHADLEDELVRAAGEGLLARLIEEQGDAGPWHTFRRQHAWEGRPVHQQFRRFIRSRSERNGRYIKAIIEAIDVADLPRPLRRLLDYVRP